jgi:non-heme chloroperoxidase
MKSNPQLYYEESGEGEKTVVLIHGSLGDFRDWRNQVSFLSRSGFKVINYSRRNHYPNSWEAYPSDYSIVTESEDLLRLIEEKEPLSLVGHSYGAFVAAVFARDHPKLLEKVVLAEPPIFTVLGKSEEQLSLGLKFLKNTIEPAREFLREANYEQALRIFLEGITGIKDVYDILKPEFRQVMLDNVGTALPEIEITPERDPFFCEDSQKIVAPTLLVKGERSPRILQEVVMELSKCIRNCKLVTIPRASHGMTWENAQDFNKEIITFLRN